MTTVPITHPLARATSTSHPWTECVEQSEAEALALDARVDALALVLALGPAVEAELRALAIAISSAAGREAFGGQYAGELVKWRNVQIGIIRTHAVRLGYNPQDLELRWCRQRSVNRSCRAARCRRGRLMIS